MNRIVVTDPYTQGYADACMDIVSDQRIAKGLLDYYKLIPWSRWPVPLHNIIREVFLTDPKGLSMFIDKLPKE